LYQLVPRKKNLPSFAIQDYFYIKMFELGVGFPIAAGSGLQRGSLAYAHDNANRNPFQHEGYYITQSQSQAMALVAEGIRILRYGMKEQWDHFTDQEKGKITSDWIDVPYLWRGLIILNESLQNEFLNLLQRFYDFAMKSGGFWIR